MTVTLKVHELRPNILFCTMIYLLLRLFVISFLSSVLIKIIVKADKEFYHFNLHHVTREIQPSGLSDLLQNKPAGTKITQKPARSIEEVELYCEVKTKALISFAVVIAKLICAFVFAHANYLFPHDEAHNIFFLVLYKTTLFEDLQRVAITRAT